MTKPPGAAKAKPKKPRARKAAATKTATKPKKPIKPVPLDWPPGLTEEDAQRVFSAIESGEKTVKSAATLAGRKGNEFYRWAKQHPRFAALLQEAIDIGCLMAEDTYREVHAVDKDTAAAANVKFTGIDRWLRSKNPEKHHAATHKPPVQVNLQLNFEQELLAARERAFGPRVLLIEQKK